MTRHRAARTMATCAAANAPAPHRSRHQHPDSLVRLLRHAPPPRSARQPRPSRSRRTHWVVRHAPAPTDSPGRPARHGRAAARHRRVRSACTLTLVAADVHVSVAAAAPPHSIDVHAAELSALACNGHRGEQQSICTCSTEPCAPSILRRRACIGPVASRAMRRPPRCLRPTPSD